MPLKMEIKRYICRNEHLRDDIDASCSCEGTNQ